MWKIENRTDWDKFVDEHEPILEEKTSFYVSQDGVHFVCYFNAISDPRWGLKFLDAYRPETMFNMHCDRYELPFFIMTNEEAEVSPRL